MSAEAAVVVRPLRLTDVPRLVALERELFGPSAWPEVMLREELEAPGRWYVGIDGDDVVSGDASLVATSRCVAYGGLWFDGEVAQVMTLGVAPSAQGRGMGSVLLSALVEQATQLGARAVHLEVRIDNEPAIGLYRRFGFSVLRRRRRYYQPEDVDAWAMGLTL